MFSKILIANRGEIAVRVARTCRRLGIATVAVYSDADAEAMHVDLCDEAWRLGPPPVGESYLRGEAILEAARRTGAEAIHPGYGFLSENAAFARACAAAGVVFIGPTPEAIDAMGSKSESKRLMEQAGVPLVPGYHGTDQSLDALRAAADGIGYPVLVKASAGGGGKGMRVVRDPAALSDAVEGARREAANAFGDDRLLIEKYLDAPRHVEIQVFGDTQGNVVHLFERDCSIQRRHQKVLEEAPAPDLPADIRAAMGAAGVAAARAIGYVGAGTVEFLVQDGRFFFIEMNTRLQVEHPVTEMITGQDLVEWQLRVASGAPLPCAQTDLAVTGHAIEARVYAEDPANDFLPSIGHLHHLRTPPEGPHVRVDTGVRQGDRVSMHYDPMIAKLVVWDVDRPAALRRLRTALAAYQVVGVATNLAFLGGVAAHPAFAAGAVGTGFIDDHTADLFPEAESADDTVLALAALDALLHRQEQAAAAAARSGDPFSPWHGTDGWRLNDDNYQRMAFLEGEAARPVTVHYRSDGYRLDLPGGSVMARGEIAADGDLVCDIDGFRRRVTVVRSGLDRVILDRGRQHRLTLDDPAARAAERETGGTGLAAPMPGKILRVLVQVGDVVDTGTPLMVLEAMKMEHTIRAHARGTIAAVHYDVGDPVEDGAALLAFEPGDP
ncbi:acetyl/propionyl/methylcrotonyl-CoA carboxylase subunit alpha [Roseospira marina]|uniref:Acetyl/propionyl/methylcrotonyl-CoA carboxylase subunit alpha n=1 Tax=Roseospira marina TaxID=140057 RepID=A0A5M6IGZ4_9PROT|nr:acetyl/propionyl/methylcrotonyl-CoA carboxylase subunit alpha [Roseospira marina]KAA5606945.1 acetyl/propionyl/methylcrotonyl-CoA carboxylase subunit alpha [Roseospira marina]MBB4312880.1 3-methylcrotonyl-CoA carboxylase alpha subunit [Roseospira marina]MBB5086347.1 3-methylcrotonyl-CoA carboxylase alpha subunit [Roseospira marina]